MPLLWNCNCKSVSPRNTCAYLVGPGEGSMSTLLLQAHDCQSTTPNIAYIFPIGTEQGTLSCSSGTMTISTVLLRVTGTHPTYSREDYLNSSTLAHICLCTVSNITCIHHTPWDWGKDSFTFSSAGMGPLVL